MARQTLLQLSKGTNVIISHEFYLTDAIAGIATTTPSAACDSVEAIITAIEEASTLTPASRREYTEQLKDALTQRICEFFAQMNYLDMRKYLVRLIKWVVENRTDDRHLLRLVDALEKHAQPIAEATEDSHETDPSSHNGYEYNLYPDEVAWRMLVNYEGDFTLPYTFFDNEDEDGDEEDGIHFQWRKFVTDYKWTPVVRYESRIFDTVQLTAPISDKESAYRDLTFSRHGQSTLVYTLDPSSCATPIVHGTGNGGMGDAIILPRAGMILHVGVDRASRTSLLEDGLRIENAALGLFAVDVAVEPVYDHPLYERSATVELMDDGTVRILTPPTRYPAWS